MNDRYDAAVFLGYLEGDLSESDRRAFEETMARDPRLALLVRQMEADRQGLRQTPAVPAPAELMDAVNQQFERRMLLDERPSGETAPAPVYRLRRIMVYGSLAALLGLSTFLVISTLSGLGWVVTPGGTAGPAPMAARPEDAVTAPVAMAPGATPRIVEEEPKASSVAALATAETGDSAAMTSRATGDTSVARALESDASRTSAGVMDSDGTASERLAATPPGGRAREELLARKADEPVVIDAQVLLVVVAEDPMASEDAILGWAVRNGAKPTFRPAIVNEAPAVASATAESPAASAARASVVPADAAARPADGAAAVASGASGASGANEGHDLLAAAVDVIAQAQQSREVNLELPAGKIPGLVEYLRNNKKAQREVNIVAQAAAVAVIQDGKAQVLANNTAPAGDARLNIANTATAASPAMSSVGDTNWGAILDAQLPLEPTAPLLGSEARVNMPVLIHSAAHH